MKSLLQLIAAVALCGLTCWFAAEMIWVKTVESLPGVNMVGIETKNENVFAQQDIFDNEPRQRFRRRGGYRYEPVPGDRNGAPDWETNSEFKHDVFTFARIKYTSQYDIYGQPQWSVDYPDSDLNFSFRLHELTSMEVDPDGVIVELTDEELFDYPFVYLIEPGTMALTRPEIEGMRRYLLNGGFMMIDDFWGVDEWQNLREELKRVFPDREPQEIELDHEIFNLVYQLDEKPQIPSIGWYFRGYRTERYDAQEPHYWIMKDDDQRIMMIICHNTDLGDGWEREGMNEGYFKEYSERWAYPLGINIVTYALTH